MELHSSFDSIQTGGSWVTIGSFDGMHLGHQALVIKLVEGAHGEGLPAIVVTFHPHPSVVLRNIQGPFYLATQAEKTAIIDTLQVDHLATLTFDKSMAQWTAEEFMEKLVLNLRPRRLLIGPGFALGRKREGNQTRLEGLGTSWGYTLESVPPFLLDQQVVSSSRIRELLQNREVEMASKLLGRNFTLTGKVVPGDGRGRQIGIPTANIEIPPERLIPGNGVFATIVRMSGQKRIWSVSNIGLRPTFEASQTLARVETHLLDFTGDLYGQNLELEFAAYLRPEQRFSSINQLVEQIQKDITLAKEILSHVP